MLKAALPYLQVSSTEISSFSIKFQELQHTMSLATNEGQRRPGICSPLPEEAPHSMLDMLEAIKPYGSTDGKQSFIDPDLQLYPGQPHRITISGNDCHPPSADNQFSRHPAFSRIPGNT